ncbi:MAG: hypothetical protein AAB431_03945 [Patescibacteria group bacterium]
MREFVSNTGEASHGDAQSDIMGGAAITVMALLVGMAGLVLILLMLVVNTTSQAQAKEKQVQAQTAEIAQLKSISGLTPEEIKTFVSAQQSEQDVQNAQQERDEAKQKQEQAESQAAAANAAAAQAQAAAAAANAAAAAANNGAQSMRVAQEDAQFYKGRVDALTKALAESERQLAKAKTELEQEKKKAEQPVGMLVSTSLRLWTFRNGETFITDAEPSADGKFWTQRYACRKKNRKVPSTTRDQGQKDILLGQ